MTGVQEYVNVSLILKGLPVKGQFVSMYAACRAYATPQSNWRRMRIECTTLRGMQRRILGAYAIWAFEDPTALKVRTVHKCIPV